MSGKNNDRRESPRPESVSRRTFIKGVGAAASLAVAPAFLRSARGDSLHINSSLFALGVVSGDPASRSVVIWTRLAPEPLNSGGMPYRPVPVTWRVATDYGMTNVIREGLTVALPRHGHAVRVVVHNLPSDGWFYYRFEALGEHSRVGRTRTFPDHRDHAERMRFAVVSCQDYTQGFYTAYRDMLDKELDFVLHTGDYIYEDGPVATPVRPGRNHLGGEIFTVEDYRNRYAQYRLDPDLQAVHAALPFLVTWDEHEVDNNYAAMACSGAIACATSIPNGGRPPTGRWATSSSSEISTTHWRSCPTPTRPWRQMRSWRYGRGSTGRAARRGSRPSWPAFQFDRRLQKRDTERGSRLGKT